MTKVWGLSAIVWTGLCLAVTVLYLFLWPQQKVTADTALARHFVLRFCHALVWLLLAVSFWLRGLDGLDGGVTAANRVALAALVAYLVFIATFLTS
ncbi:hypothetical protein BH24DEI2_BH24DEI2_28230 [soil metagenome]